MKRLIRFLITVIVVAGVVGGGYWYYRNHKTPTATAASTTTYTQVVAVKQGTLSSTISVVGQLEATQSATMAFDKMNSTAKLQTLTIKAGSPVTNGQVLATIDATPYQTALDQANTALQAAQKTLADLNTPATSLEIGQADVAVAKAQQSVEQAKSDLAAITNPDLASLKSAVQDAQDSIAVLQLQGTLADHNTLAKNERDLSYTVNWYERRMAELQAMTNPNLEQTTELATDKVTQVSAQTDLARIQAERELARLSREAELAKDKVVLANAQAALATATAGGDALALSKAQVSLQTAQVGLQAAQDARTELAKGSDATTIATAQANIDKLTLSVSDATAALAGTRLVAPFDGTILKTNANAGDLVAANTIVLTVANLKTLQVAASVDETTIKNVKEGQTAVVTFDAFPGQQLQGKVGAVPLQGTLQGGIMIYSVPISLTGADKLALLVGMTANVKIQAGTATNALLVPSMALTKANGQYQVMVPNTTSATGAPETVPVEVGLSDGTYTQVTKGLNAGDNVIVQVKATTSTTNRSNQSSGGIFNLSRLFGGR